MHTITCTRTHTRAHTNTSNVVWIKSGRHNLIQILNFGIKLFSRYLNSFYFKVYFKVGNRLKRICREDIKVFRSHLVNIHILTHIYIYTCTHEHMHLNTHTHTHTYTYTQDAASHVLVSEVSPEGAVDRNSGGISPDALLLKFFKLTLWTDVF